MNFSDLSSLKPDINELKSELSRLCEQYGISRKGVDLDSLDYDLPVDANDKYDVLVSAPKSETVREYLHNEILNAVSDRLPQTVRVPGQLLLADESPSAVSVELDGGQHIANEGLKPAVLSPVVADEVGGYFLFRRQVVQSFVPV